MKIKSGMVHGSHHVISRSTSTLLRQVYPRIPAHRHYVPALAPGNAGKQLCTAIAGQDPLRCHASIAIDSQGMGIHSDRLTRHGDTPTLMRA
eukprot:scaffold102172_cov34-Tisochrysis_lutea.AAC.2